MIQLRPLAGAALLALALPSRAQEAGAAAPPPTGETAPATAPAGSPGEEELGPAQGVANLFLQTNTPLTNEKGLFDVSLTHRFLAPANQAGASGAFGLDYGTSMGLAMDYVPVRNVAVQVRRVDVGADYEFAAKVTALRPTSALPLALGGRGGLDWQTASYATRQSAGFLQLLASYTIANRVTLSANPACVQRTPTHDGSVCNVPLAMQVRITRSIAAMAEYVPARKGIVPDGVGQWSFAVEKSVFHHRFALWIGNAGGTNVDQILAGDFNGGVTDSNIRIGFNLVRQFEIATE